MKRPPNNPHEAEALRTKMPIDGVVPVRVGKGAYALRHVSEIVSQPYVAKRKFKGSKAAKRPHR